MIMIDGDGDPKFRSFINWRISMKLGIRLVFWVAEYEIMVKMA